MRIMEEKALTAWGLLPLASISPHHYPDSKALSHVPLTQHTPAGKCSLHTPSLCSPLAFLQNSDSASCSGDLCLPTLPTPLKTGFRGWGKNNKNKNRLQHPIVSLLSAQGDRKSLLRSESRKSVLSVAPNLLACGEKDLGRTRTLTAGIYFTQFETLPEWPKQWYSGEGTCPACS